MKKTKIFTGVVATGLLSVTPVLITLTSCNPKKPTSSIDIKTNPNINIECKSITVGENLVLKYKIDDSYAFDIEKSSITFADSNTTVYLTQCDVDRINKTITVPGEYVTSEKVTIDIKAEDAKTSTVTEAEYQTAVKKIINVDANRSFTLSAQMTSYKGPEAQEIKLIETNEINLNAKGFKEYQAQKQISYEPYGEYKSYCWAEPDSIVGNWEYQSDGGKAMKSPCVDTFGHNWMVGLFTSQELATWSNFVYDPLYNAYISHLYEQEKETVVAIKFVNKNISYLGLAWGEVNYEGNICITDQRYEFEYTSEEVVCPTEWEYIGINQIHNEDSKYSVKNKGVSYTYDTQKDDYFGRYTIPLNKYTSWVAANPIMIDIIATDKSSMDGMRVAIANGTTVVDPTNYTIDETTGKITIQGNVIDTSKELIVILDWTDGFSGGWPQVTNPTSLDVYQE